MGINPLSGQTFNPRQPAPGNPYAANTTFAPPPRRTQPGTWQRPQPHTGADRFTNFPRPAPTARTDAAQDTQNKFKAWEKMQYRPAQAQHPRPQPPPQFMPPQQPPPPQAHHQRPQPPPRQGSRFAAEDQVKAGMRSSKMPPPNFDNNQTAWQAFQKANASQPGMARTAPGMTPRKQGFNPNMSGSDEKPADAHYFHRNHSADFGRPKPGPHGPPPASSTPVSPVLPTSQRPYPDPTRPSSSRAPNDQVPFAEGNRDRTPYGSSYASYIRERTDLGDGLRRSHSTRDTTKLDPRDAANQSRARSTSPLRRQRASESYASNPSKKAFDLGYSSSESSENVTPDADGTESDRPNTAPTSHRPNKAPTPPSARFNSTSTGPYSPPMPNVNGATDGAHSESERPNMQQKGNSNMYATLSFSCRPTPKSPKLCKSDTPSTSSARPAWSTIGRWAIPSSVNPFLRIKPVEESTYVTAADEVFKNATKAEQMAFFRLQTELEKWYKYIPDNLDMEVFLKLASATRSNRFCGDPLLDRLLNQVLSEFPTVGYQDVHHANNDAFANSFSFPHDADMFKPTNSRSRSEENVNTNFTSEPWNGAFGEQDFAPPPPTGRKNSPMRRSTRTPKEQTRAATVDVPNSAPAEDTPQRPWGSDGRAKENPPGTAPASSWSQDQFQNPFDWQSSQRSDSPIKGGAGGKGKTQSQGRRTSKAFNRGATTARSTQKPQAVDEDDTIEPEGADGAPERGASVMDEPEPMDIDNTPPAQNTTGAQQSQNEARLYNVPRSRRQEQEQKQYNTQKSRKTSSAARKPVPTSTNLNTNLDDLRNVEPMGKIDGTSAETFNFDSISASLPIQSQAASKSIKPNKLSLPLVPKAPMEPTKLTKTSWPDYVQNFSAYVNAFHKFNQAMIQHFATREQLVGLNFHNTSQWLQAAGDTSGMSTAQTGFDTYLAIIQEDAGVREHWNVGCERHAEAVTNFGKVRDRVKKLAEGGGLADN